MQEFGLEVVTDIADLVQESRPGRSGLEAARFAGLGSGEGSSFVPEQGGLDQVIGNGHAVDVDEGTVPAGTARMNVFGDHLFAATAFSADDDRGFGSRHAVGDREHLFHRRGGGQHLAAGPFGQSVQRQANLPAFHRLLDDLFEKIEVRRLGQEIVGATLKRPDNLVHRSVGRQDDHVGRITVGAKLGQDLEAVHDGHRQIQQDQVEGVLRRRGQGLASIGCHRNLAAPEFETILEGPAQRLVVINDQHLANEVGHGGPPV